MTKRNGKHIPGILLLSKPDDVQLAIAVERNFLYLCQMHVKQKGMELPIPDFISSDIRQWRALRVRHKVEDFRHSEAEMRSVKAIAEWTLEISAELRGQKKPEKIVWR